MALGQRIKEWLWLKGTSGAHLVYSSAQAGPPRAGPLGPRPGGFGGLQGEDSAASPPGLPGPPQLVPGIFSLQVQEIALLTELHEVSVGSFFQPVEVWAPCIKARKWEEKKTLNTLLWCMLFPTLKLFIPAERFSSTRKCNSAMHGLAVKRTNTVLHKRKPDAKCEQGMMHFPWHVRIHHIPALKFCVFCLLLTSSRQILRDIKRVRCLGEMWLVMTDTSVSQILT